MVYILLELLRKNVFNYVKSTKSVNIFHCYCRNIMSCFILTQDVDKRAFKFATQIVHLLLKCRFPGKITAAMVDEQALIARNYVGATEICGANCREFLRVPL